jgi:pimeloyl-ACP methyl ester carboxylesterase
MADLNVRRITLRDGRALAYVERGDPQGLPVVYCHGVPSSRAEADVHGHAATLTSLGVRLIVPDRPGVGDSDEQPNRTVVDWADDVRDLASQLGLGSFAVVGASGGAPYALACGVRLRENVCAVGIVGGIAPLDAPGVLTSFSAPLRVMFRLGRRAPPILNWLLKLNLRAVRRGGDRAGARMAAMAPEPDRTLLQQPEVQRRFTACFDEACRRGTTGPTIDVGIVARPWGFDLRSIEVPVFLWHGARDANVPVACGRYLAEVIPGCRATFYAEDAHLSVPVNHCAEIFTSIIAACRKRDRGPAATVRP